MAIPSLDRFLEILRLSGLIDEDDLTRFLKEQYGAETPPADTPPQDLAERLLKADLITNWHAEKLLDGKYKGFRLGNYRLRDFLGSGGMSSVYLAEHVHMHQSRAVKVLPRKKNDESSRLKRFYLEARASAQLRHDNIVQVYDIDSQGDDIHYIVMEYVRGRDLAKAVREDGPLPFDVCLSYMIQAAEALQHAHENGLVHRDVKPGNFLVDDKGMLKCMDLGLALFASQDDHSLTQEFNEKVLGTADYLSPEQALNSHNVDHRADIYSLGCTMYYCLTGSAPFPEGTLAQRILNHQTKMPEDPRVYRPEIPQAFVDLIWRMIQKRPEDRLQTASAVAHELRRLQTQGWETSRIGAPATVGSSAGVRPATSPSGAVSRPGSRSGGASGSSSDVTRNKPPSNIERQAAAARDSAIGRSGPQAAVPAGRTGASGSVANGAPGSGSSNPPVDAQRQALAAIAADRDAQRAAARRGKAADGGRPSTPTAGDSGPQARSPSDATPATATPAPKVAAPAGASGSSPGVRSAGPAVRTASTPTGPSAAPKPSGPVSIATGVPAAGRSPARASSPGAASPVSLQQPRVATPATATAASTQAASPASESAVSRALPGRRGKKNLSPVMIVLGILGLVAFIAVVALAVAFSGSGGSGEGGGGGSGGPSGTETRPGRRSTASLEPAATFREDRICA